jgi:diamine N-acetyltransferase
MSSSKSQDRESRVTLHAVNSDNWRDVAALEVREAQQAFVAEPTYYLALCCYGDTWQPLAIYTEERVIGFMMWAVDPADGSCWLGGILIDKAHQGQGYGREAVRAAIAMLSDAGGYEAFALSYNPTNTAAKHLYETLGFVETDEWEDDEIVARLSIGDLA